MIEELNRLQQRLAHDADRLSTVTLESIALIAESIARMARRRINDRRIAAQRGSDARLWRP